MAKTSRIEASADDAEVLASLLARRHSCRGFSTEPVPRAHIEQLLAIAQRTPSWCNTQPWQVIITSGARLNMLRTLYSERVSNGTQGDTDLGFPTAYRGVYLERRRTCGYALYSSVGIAKGDRERTDAQMLENYRFFGAPHLAVITTERDLGDYGAVDCGGYIATFLLVAEALGIAAVPQAAIATHSSFLREFFDLPDTRQVVAGISFGWRDDAHPANGFRTERASIEEAVSWVE
ncbi:nitroreductase [Mesorhizobium australicum]|uniref:Nitroreductase n=1 Tax=Mesorhizobium australicum TaxID=536018 RepID=A0A1X7NHD0_9HYPH|nr:nitroreductase [Mesorhizobium australicum]SMH36355.1 Nitroreductase [Mesorhizobium australicum]